VMIHSQRCLQTQQQQINLSCTSEAVSRNVSCCKKDMITINKAYFLQYARIINMKLLNISYINWRNSEKEYMTFLRIHVETISFK
jgi:hypothetical protein